MFIVPYEELTALHICQILLKRGASPNGNAIYEMRPLHIAIRRQWTQVSRLLLEAGKINKYSNLCLKKIIFIFRS